MAITLNQVATHAKELIREPISDSISVTLMEDYVRSVYFDWCQELSWPEADFTQDSVADQQEYTLPDTLNKIFRVYINGQRAAPTTIPILEGDVQQRFDPSWRIDPAISIPALSGGSFQSVPITAGASYATLKYYLRGGKLGFQPKPAAIYEIRIEGAAFPASPASGDNLQFPDQFKDGLAYGACYRFLLSDRRTDEAAGFLQLHDKEMGKAMRWRRMLAGTDQLPAVQPHDYRGWYGRR